jgi:hypothetical protein|tara:strand:+ start:1249 stop:1509 length:261 start_codon:yes stop_codon:yes gene_type:complete
MSKITNEEMEALQSLISEFEQGKLKLGDLELQKSIIISNIGTIKQKFAEEEQKLINKYGDNSVINLKTGEITEKETEESSEKEKED